MTDQMYVFTCADHLAVRCGKWDIQMITLDFVRFSDTLSDQSK